MTPIRAFLEKRAVHRQWPDLAGCGTVEGLRHVTVIPVLAEFDNLFLTLGDLAANDRGMLAQTAIVCVVNNRAPEIAGERDCADNARTLAALPDFARNHPELRLAWVDAVSTGRYLGPKEGVGLARKIGLDWGLALLAEAGHPAGALISLDADTRVAPDYLRAIDDFLRKGERWAAVVDYAHPVEGPDGECLPILSYELSLRYQELAWYYAGSPYAYPAIGSTMVCTGASYAAAGGMNRRQAGEDFYFLQQLAKTGYVERIRETRVVPSGRASHRVPFGTGRKVGAFASDPDDAYLTYHPDSFRILKDWLASIHGALSEPGDALVGRAAGIEPELARYLEGQRFAEAWDLVRRHSASESQRARQFHQWFDAFRTLKLVHHLRDNGFPRQDLFDALGQAMAWHGLQSPVAVRDSPRHDAAAQRTLLEVVRAWRPPGE